MSDLQSMKPKDDGFTLPVFGSPDAEENKEEKKLSLRNTDTDKKVLRSRTMSLAGLEKP